MTRGFFQRLRAAAGHVFRSYSLPFDFVPLDGGGSDSDLRQPFAQSAWVMRAIKKIAGPISAVPLKFSIGETEVNDPTLAKFWEHPTRHLARPDFIEACVIWLKLKGETFLLLGDDALRPFPEAASFTPLIVPRPDRMREVIENGELAGWQYTDAAHRRQALLPEQVIHSKFFNPYDEYRGLAEYESARIAAEGDYAAGEYARNLMQNNGDSGPIIANKSGMLTDEQQRQILSQLRMKRDLARRGDFRAAFLTADVEVKNPTAQTVNGDFVNMRVGNRYEIFLAFGVPPSMADKMESYSVGSASDWFLLISETCIPTGEKIAAAITAVARRQTGKELTAYFDWDEHPVMQAVRRERMDNWTKLVDRGMPGELASDALDMDLPAYPAGKVGLLPFNLSPFDASAPATEPPETAPEFEEPEAVTEARRALRAGEASVPASRGSSGASPHQPDCPLDLGRLEIRAGDSKDARRWKSIVAKRRETIRAYESKFNAVLMVARREVLQKLERAAALEPKAAVARAAAADFIFNLGNFKKLFFAQMRNVGRQALQAAGDQLFKEIGRDDPWQMPSAETLKHLANRENKLSHVPDDVFDRIRDTLDSGLRDGDSLTQIAGAVRAEFNDISAGRAMVIAQTETAAAYGVGRQRAMEDAGIEWKEWLVSGNSKVRAAHQLMAGVRAKIDEPFLVVDPKTGETDEVMHPADPDGEPWNVINCHCVEVAVLEGPDGEAEPSA